MKFHTWIGIGDGPMSSCLICGGVWDYKPGPLWMESHLSMTGEPAVDCTGNRNQCHHYPGECSLTDGSPCLFDPACNCLHCFS